MIHPIHPVILCGGSGTRLWPVSRRSFPKQFVDLLGEGSPFQAAARRLHGMDGVAPPRIVTGEPFRFIVREQLAQAGVAPARVLVEPEPRNTAPAILAAALELARTDPEALMIAMPADHLIRDRDAFREAVARGAEAAAAGRIVTFGVVPDRPATEYGYLEIDADADEDGVVPVRRFREKPARAEAEALVAGGGALWNAGIFLFRVCDMLDAFSRHAPDLTGPVVRALDAGREDLGFLRLAAEPWSEAEDISIDYAVMERLEALAAVPLAAGWNDLGGWEAIRRESGPDSRGVTVRGEAHAIDCADSHLQSEEGITLVGLGLSGVVAVATPDAVLVADRSRTQEVREVVRLLRERKVPQADRLPRDHRPWGWFESLATGQRFQVKRIHVNPGAALSLQSHFHRSEHWIVVQGTARVTIGDEVRIVSENESVYVPLGERHRLENPGKVPLVLIEVQTGAYLGEDDIVRYEDLYARPPNGD